MKIKCQFMELGKPLFLGGTNYGEKLKPQSGKGPIEITWDTEERLARVSNGKFYTFITEPWVFTFEPEQENKFEVKQNYPSTNPNVTAQVGGPTDVLKQVDGRMSAQVETPIDKVQKRGPGRPAKFQGEGTQGE